MFETSVARARAVRRPWLLPASIGVHAAIVVAVAVASVSSVHLPQNAPNEMQLYRLEPPPPPFGTPNGGHPHPAVAQPQQPRPQAAAPRTDVAPPIIPDHVPTVASGPPATATGPASDTPGTDGPIGVPNGVPGGIDIGQLVQPAMPVQPDVVYRAGVGNVKAPVVIRRVAPPYPRLAIAAHRSGWAIVECTIDKSGHIRDAHVVGSSWEVFEQPALEAVQQWTFTPGTLDGKAVDVVFELRVTFEIR